jgi:hypothetical protein
MDSINMGNYSYLDSVTFHPEINNTTSYIIEYLNDSSLNLEINNIRNDVLSYLFDMNDILKLTNLNDDFQIDLNDSDYEVDNITCDVDIRNETICDNENDILCNEFICMYLDIIKRFNILKDEYFDINSKLKNEINRVRDDVNELNKMIEFTKNINVKYKRSDLVESINKNILELSHKIKSDNNIKDIKKEYFLNKIEINKYLNLVRKINKMNLSAICPVCLTNKITKYLNPCGHTCCDECVEKFCFNSNNCFICRKNITSSGDIYIN